MKPNLYSLDQFSPEDITATQPALKVGVLATVNPDGLPHLTLISTLMACAPHQLSWGAFTEGMSKQHVRTNPRVGFLIMTLDKTLWRGRALFTHTASHGPEYDFYNNIPMFRYNAYFGVHTVYYGDLVAHTGRLPLPMNRVIFAAVQTMIARNIERKATTVVMNPWTVKFFNKLDNLKFISYVDQDGFPAVIPAIQTQALDSSRLILSGGVFANELSSIPDGCHAAVFGMALTMEDVLVRGRFHGLHRVGGIPCAQVDVDWVYNPMPPAPAQIFPPVPLEPVTAF